MIYAAAKLEYNNKILVSKKKDAAQWTIPHQVVLNEEPVVSVLSNILSETPIPFIFDVSSVSEIHHDRINLTHKYSQGKIVHQFMYIYLFDIDYSFLDKDILNYYLYSEPKSIRFLDYEYFIDHLTISPINHILVRYMVETGHNSFGGKQ
jgi:hypothetical protein